MEDRTLSRVSSHVSRNLKSSSSIMSPLKKLNHLSLERALVSHRHHLVYMDSIIDLYYIDNTIEINGLPVLPKNQHDIDGNQSRDIFI